MASDFKYKGFEGSMEFQADACYFYGSVRLDRDHIRYEAATVEELEINFKSSVDNYLADCAAIGINPG